LQASDVLTVVAEISIALAGFTGIVVAYRQRGVEEFELIRQRFMLGVACVTLFFALLPFLPHHLGVAPSGTWLFSSAVMAVGFGLLTLLTYFRTRAQLNRLSFVWFWAYVSGSAVFSGIAIVNTAGVLGHASPGLYLAGLGWLLFFSISLFVRLILAPVSPG
jgi:hypothetical protein